VGNDLLLRTAEFRRELLAANSTADLLIPEKVAPRLAHFPDKPLKEKDAGFDQFQANITNIGDRWAPLYQLVASMCEFKDGALQLFAEMSERIVKLDTALNLLAYRRYFELMLLFARLHLLLSSLCESRGRLVLSAYCTAHMLSQHSYPSTMAAVYQYLLDYCQPLKRMQDDFARVRLRVECLLPLGRQVKALCDPAMLRKEIEANLSPLAEKKGKGQAALSRREGPSMREMDSRRSAGAIDEQIDVPLAHLAEIKQWLVFGMLLFPEALGEPDAIDLLLAVLNTMYVIPVHGTDVLWPHAEFEAMLKAWDSKTSLRLLRKKEEAKRLKTGLSDSRLAAFRNAAPAHLAVRTTLCTKLQHLQAVIQDTPDLLYKKMPKVLCALRLAQDEVQWWALHFQAVPEEIPKKVREEVTARDDANAWAPVITLVRGSMALKELVRKEHGGLLEAAQNELADDILTNVESLVNAAPHDKFPGADCGHIGQVLRDMPAHLESARSVGCDLRGLRLNVLRIVCDLSCAGAYALVQNSSVLQNLLHDLQMASTISEGIDNVEPLLFEATDAQALLADDDKFKMLFQAALEHTPLACVPMLQLAAAGSARPAQAVHAMLRSIDDRVTILLKLVALHLHEKRTASTPAQAQLTHHQATHRLATLCSALDCAPPLLVSGGVFSPREWLRERFEIFLERVLVSLFFSNDGLVPPTVSLAQMHDWSNALASIRYFTSIDLHGIFNAACARELGYLDSQGGEARYEDANEPSIRSRGIDPTAAAAAASTKKPGSALLIDRIVDWYKRVVGEAAAKDASIYAPGRRAFGAGSALDSIQFAALVRLVGAAGARRLHDMLVKMAASYASKVRAMLNTNQQELAKLMTHFDMRHELLMPLQLANMPEGLAYCKSLGVVLAVRKLLLVGIKQAKTELFPASVSSFVKGLGEQQLPDGQRAADGQHSVAELLASFGLAGSQTTEPPFAPSSSASPKDALLEAELDAQCGISSDAKLWMLLPYALGAGFAYDNYWGAAVPHLAENAVSANIHTLAHAYHGLLSAVEPHMPRPRTGAPSGSKLAHRRFLHVSSLVLLQLRTAAHGNKDAKPQNTQRAEHVLAAMVMVIEQLVQLAGSLTYGDLQAFLPIAVVNAQYLEEQRTIQTVDDDASLPTERLRRTTLDDQNASMNDS